MWVYMYLFAQIETQMYLDQFNLWVSTDVFIAYGMRKQEVWNPCGVGNLEEQEPLYPH